MELFSEIFVGTLIDKMSLKQHGHLPDEWKHETIGSEMTVLF